MGWYNIRLYLSTKLGAFGKSRHKEAYYDWWMHLPNNNWHLVPNDSHVSATIEITSKHLPEFLCFFMLSFYVTNSFEHALNIQSDKKCCSVVAFFE